MAFKLEHQGANQIRIASLTNMADGCGRGFGQTEAGILTKAGGCVANG